jgi:hypothetical protein
MTPPDEAAASIAFAQSLAQAYVSRGGDSIDLFAAFVGIVVSEDKDVGLRCLEATDRWLNRGDGGLPQK